MNELTTFANPQVLEFYKALPFNYFGSVEKQAESLASQNAVLSQPVLDQLLKKGGMRCLDVGCGAGWLANSIAYYYKLSTTGIDFNPVVVQRAREVAHFLKLNTTFSVEDLFLYKPQHTFDVACSMGVLHHTDNCHKAVQHICRNIISDKGYVYIGLYHYYGRKSFLEHFTRLKEQGYSEEQLYQRFKELRSGLTDETHTRSWFRDQAIHPHETQHTLEEMVEILKREDMTLISTSINRFEQFNSLEKLFELEKMYEDLGRSRLKENKYFPGFFTFLARKNI
jgi:SAM-dependent methyltransferase